MEGTISLLTGPSATALGTFSSIVSLLLTVIVYINIRKIRKFYLFTARMPQLCERIALKSSSLLEHLNSFSGVTVTIRTLLTEIEVLLASLNGIVDGVLRKQILALLKEIEAMDKSGGIFKSYFSSTLKDQVSAVEVQRRNIENIYISLQKILATCSAKHEDARWER